MKITLRPYASFAMNRGACDVATSLFVSHGEVFIQMNSSLAAEQVTQLTRTRQRFVSDMLDTVLQLDRR